MKHSAKNSLSISAFFPCYNERENIAETYETVSRVLAELTDDYEVVFVDDGSDDGSAEVLSSIARKDPRVRIVTHPKNLGYGSALRSGFAASTKDVLFYSDCDSQFDLNELKAVIPLIREYDIVSCYRKKRSEGLSRSLNAILWRAFIYAVFGKNIRDVDCAFKIYRKKIFEGFELVSTGALIDAEVLVRSLNRGYTMVQRGVSHYPRKNGMSSGSNPRVVVRALSEAFKYRKHIMHDK